MCECVIKAIIKCLFLSHKIKITIIHKRENENCQTLSQLEQRTKRVPSQNYYLRLKLHTETYRISDYYFIHNNFCEKRLTLRTILVGNCTFVHLFIYLFILLSNASFSLSNDLLFLLSRTIFYFAHSCIFYFHFQSFRKCHRRLIYIVYVYC
jgi:hypothetical protein